MIGTLAMLALVWFIAGWKLALVLTLIILMAVGWSSLD